MAKHMTSDGETVDSICWNFYGATDGTVEAVLEANKGIEDYGPRLPAGISVELPEIVVTSVSASKAVRLWD